MRNNGIEILKMANGWMVTLPQEQPDYTPRGFDYSKMVDELLPQIGRLTGKMQEDPVLAKIRDDNEVKKGPVVTAQPLIDPNPYVYIFKTFGEVLTFLDERFHDA